MAEPVIADAPAKLSSFLQAVQEPISPSAPAGTDVTYEEDFQSLKAEIDKLSTAAADQVDFDLAVTLSKKLLQERTKDLRVAVFLAMALNRTDGFRGVAEGIAATRIVTETFWEDAFPPKRRMNARRNALQLLSDRLKEWLADDKPSAEDEGHIERAIDEIKALQEFAMREMEDKAPAVTGLVKALEAAQRRVPTKAEPKPTPVAKPAGTSTPSAGAAPQAASASGTSVGDVRSANEAKREVTRLAYFLHTDDLKAPEAYAIARAAKWGGLEGDLPNENGKTLVEAPPSARRSYLQGLLPRSDFEKLVREAEDSFREPPFHFWLDLQRLQAAAMDALGDPYRPALDAILLATAALVHRLPELTKLSFSDGSPFADPLTQEWIDTEVRSKLGGGGGGGGMTMRLGSDHLEEQYEAVRKKAGRGGLAEAVAAMQQGREQDTTSQDRFLRQLYIAELCLRGGQPGIAAPMLESLDEAVARHHLDTWEPALALRVWTSLHRCYEQLAAEDDADPAHAQRARAVFDKVCRVDAGYALATLG